MGETLTATVLKPHKMDVNGAVHCHCGKRLGFRLAFLGHERSASVALYRECKYCGTYNIVYLDKLEMC